MQFSWPPSRQLTGIGGALAIAVAAAYIAAVRDDFEAVLFAIGAAGLLLAGYQALPRRPRLELTFSEDGRSLEAVTVAGDETLRPLDLDSILRHESKAAWATAPARPDPQRSFGSAFIAHSLMGPTDENYAEFDAQVNAYLAEVRSWLSEADRRRRAKLHELHTDLRLTNSGEVAATNVRVRLRSRVVGRKSRTTPPKSRRRARHGIRLWACFADHDCRRFGYLSFRRQSRRVEG